MTPARIFVTFDHAGLHLWSTPTARRSYLAHPHRHLFKVKVETTVTHDDREIEFHDLCDFAKGLFVARFAQEDSVGYDSAIGRSCEQMARELGNALAAKYGRAFDVTVSEDGEFGATITTT